MNYLTSKLSPLYVPYLWFSKKATNRFSNLENLRYSDLYQYDHQQIYHNVGLQSNLSNDCLLYTSVFIIISRKRLIMSIII